MAAVFPLALETGSEIALKNHASAAAVTAARCPPLTHMHAFCPSSMLFIS